MDTLLREYAKAGMLVAIDKKTAELAELRTAYNKLIGRRVGRTTTAVTVAAPSRRRRRMSAAAKKAVSERMRKYWAEKRKADKSK